MPKAAQHIALKIRLREGALYGPAGIGDVPLEAPVGGMILGFTLPLADAGELLAELTKALRTAAGECDGATVTFRRSGSKWS